MNDMLEFSMVFLKLVVFDSCLVCWFCCNNVFRFGLMMGDLFWLIRLILVLEIFILMIL